MTPPARRALVRRPGPRLAEGLVAFRDRVPVDVQLAGEQWAAYRAALESAGWTIVEVAPADDCPDAVFVEDTLVVYEGLAIVTRAGAATRLAESAGAEQAALELGLPVAPIEAPGTLEGGDVLAAGRTVLVGTGGRTNAAGVAQLRALLEPRGAVVHEVPVRGVLHLKSAVAALPGGTVVGHAPPLVALGGLSVLVAADSPRVAELYASLGLAPVVVDISEFQKLDGGITCLSVLVP